MTRGSTSTAFRADINGLRAWAVISVLLYHFGVPGFSGGFVGVDVFFVISGYLMTAIVIKGLEKGRFSIISFYAARARRIVPALLALCAVLLALGYWFLAPLDYKQLATHSITAIAFLSNIKFWSEAGYFDVSSHEKWLLHTWSLSVEWQFYLLLPLLLAGVWRLRPGRSALLFVLLAGWLLSFSASVIVTPQASSAAFYLLPTRAWEMMAGGLVFMWTDRRDLSAALKRVLEIAGFAMILMAILLFDGHTPWPGWRAVWPVAGAALVLVAHQPHSHWTGHPLAQWFGDRSYSIYLWHWPVVVALAFVQQLGNPLAVAAGVLLALILGGLSFRWVEQTSRHHTGGLSAARSMGVLATTCGLVMAPALLIRSGNGLDGRIPEEAEQVARFAEDVNPRREECHASRGMTSPSCVWGGDQWRLIALGDSHTSAIVTAVAAAGGSRAGVVQWSYSGCSYVHGLQFAPEVLAKQKADYRCQDFVKWAAKRLEELPQHIPVVITNRYAAQALGANEEGSPSRKPEVYFSRIHDMRGQSLIAEFQEAIVKTACHAAAYRKVYLVRPIPEMGFDVPKVLSRRIALGYREELSISREDYMSRNQWVWAAQDEAAKKCGVEILDPTESLCDSKRCYGSRHLQPLYSDDDHLSESGNKMLVQMFKRSILLGTN